MLFECCEIRAVQVGDGLSSLSEHHGKGEEGGEELRGKGLAIINTIM